MSNHEVIANGMMWKFCEIKLCKNTNFNQSFMCKGSAVGVINSAYQIG